MSPFYNYPSVSAPGMETVREQSKPEVWNAAALADLQERVRLMRDAARANGYLADAARLDHICDLLSGDGL